MTAFESVAWGHKLKSAMHAGALAALFPISRGEQLGRLVSQDLVLQRIGTAALCCGPFAALTGLRVL